MWRHGSLPAGARVAGAGMIPLAPLGLVWYIRPRSGAIRSGRSGRQSSSRTGAGDKPTVPKRPEVIGRYQIVDQIGQGGMGSLFLAWDPLLERQIAIKLLRDDSEELRERFAREARSVARLRHPNIITIFDVGEQDGQPFIAMEYIQGQTLGDLVRSGPLTLARKLQLMGELCDGLGFAHKVGIVHRDVKPANIMVERDGVLKILDFGIARIAESGMTQAGMLIGTLNYMSPEQVAGQVVDGRSDIFAVGAVLYELLAQRQAFPGGLQNGILNRLLHEPPPPLSELCSGLDPEIIQIVSRALTKKPESRYQDLASMRKDLDTVRRRIDAAPPGVVAGDAETLAIQESAVISSRTPRRGTDREELARRRVSQIAAHLESARQAMEASEFEAAVAAAEQVLLLDAEEPNATDLIEAARAALAERQMQELLRRGSELLRAGALTQAQVLAEEALTLVPGSSAALTFRQSVLRARNEREREAQRTRRIGAAMDQARSLLQSGEFEQAEAVAADVLHLDPQSADAQALREQARQAVLDRRATATVGEAGRLFAGGSHKEALALLRGFEPAHDRVTGALRELQHELERRERERQEQLAAALREAEATAAHAAAIEILERALTLEPQHAELRRALEERRGALAAEEEAARRAREREAAMAAALKRAKAARTHGAAIEILEGALTLEPQHAELRERLAERRTALAAEEEAARRARERQEQLAAALREARATAAHALAIEILEGVLTLEPQHPELRARLAERRAALAAEEETARRARERQ